MTAPCLIPLKPMDTRRGKVYHNPMNRLLYPLILAMMVGRLGVPCAAAQSLTLYTEESPPVSFTSDGRLTGSGVAIVREILGRLDQPDTIQVVPWARGYSLMQTESNVVLFAMARTDEREDLFQWVGPMHRARTGFYALKSRGLRFDTIDDIRRDTTIAIYKDDVREQILRAQGFTDLDSSKSPVGCVKKLASGRVDLWFFDDLGMPGVARQADVDPESLERVFTFREYDGYIAMSRGTPQSTVESWQRVLDQMKRDGSFRSLSAQWLPKENFTGLIPGQLALYTEENPPGNYLADGKPAGRVVELVREILQRLGEPDTITVVPWARGYNQALSRPDVALFSTTRLPQREKLFQWVGPVYTQNWGFYAKKGTGARFTSLDQAKQVQRIGVYQDDAKEQFLREQGFTNLVSANRNTSNVRHLIQGDIDLWVSSDFNMPDIVRRAGYDPGQVELVYSFGSVENYIAFSLETPENTVAAWQRVLGEIKTDGTYAKLMEGDHPL